MLTNMMHPESSLFDSQYFEDNIEYVDIKNIWMYEIKSNRMLLYRLYHIMRNYYWTKMWAPNIQNTWYQKENWYITLSLLTSIFPKNEKIFCIYGPTNILQLYINFVVGVQVRKKVRLLWICHVMCNENV